MPTFTEMYYSHHELQYLDKALDWIRDQILFGDEWANLACYDEEVEDGNVE